jgi:hypothetical protein
MYFINLFLFNLIFNSLLLERLFKKDITITEINLINLQNDFLRIGLPYSFSLNYYFVAFFIAFFTAVLVYFSIPKSFKLSSPTEFINELLKIVIIYCFILFGILYLFRLYSFSRGIVIIGIFIYSISLYLFIWSLRLERYSNKFKLIISISALTLLTSIFFFLRQSDDEVISINSITTTTSTVFTPGIVQSDCFEWLGSNNYKGCISGIRINLIQTYNERITNIVTNNQALYVLLNDGIIINQTDESIFLDVTSKVKVFEDFFESGLFSLAFHPTENYLLVSYSDLDNNLVVEKYFTNSNNNNINNEDPEIVLKIPNSQCCHYSGNIIWSEYFEDFILSVGDMEDSNVRLLNSEPFDTTSPRGKVLLINKEISEPELLSLEMNIEPKKNILAYGLRNPWKTSEYKNFLFVPDIGHIQEEELNVLNLDEISNSKNPYLLGWPYFEGTIDNDVKYNEIFLHRNGESESINKFIEDNSIFPKVYYTHQAPENFRAALIGGGVIENSESKYYEHYFFVDYLSNELFSYDFIADELFIFPLGDLNSYITSLVVNPVKNDSILISTGSGNLVELELP